MKAKTQALTSHPIKPNSTLISKLKANDSSYSSMKILKKLSNENINNKEQSKETGVKPQLRPLSNRKKTIEKIEIDCDTDIIKDKEYLNALSQEEYSFFSNNCSTLFHFLKEINLVRYIGIFLQDAFETQNDLLLINEEYFEENDVFDLIQQQKIMNKVKELAMKESTMLKTDTCGLKESNREKKETCEFGTNTNNDKEIDSNTNTYLSVIRCWNCLNAILNNTTCVSKEYNNGLIQEKVNFCNEKCMKDFENNIIFTQCNECKKPFDKAKGDFVFENKHYCSKKCINDYCLQNSQFYYNKEEESEDDNDKEYHYDPMEDF